MTERYFVDAPITADAVRLAGAEAHHLAHVMRARPGDEVTLFDGSGAEYAARVERVGRSEIELAVFARRQVDRELPVEITLGVALPKGDRQRWLVEKATELGVARVVPLITSRGNDRESPAALAKLSRAVIEASKQCGRNRLMAIDPPTRFEAYLAAADPAALRLLAHPGGAGLPAGVADRRRIALAVGPEGGFSDEEVQAALRAGWLSVDLGPRIVRIETAALKLAALMTAGA